MVPDRQFKPRSVEQYGQKNHLWFGTVYKKCNSTFLLTIIVYNYNLYNIQKPKPQPIIVVKLVAVRSILLYIE